MAKPIYISNSEIENILTEVRSQLTNKKNFGRLEIKKEFSNDDRKAKITFTPTAWIKLTGLVKEFDTEVQWHGLVERASENEFKITDIIVPPHVVTSTTVTSDDIEYTKWLNDLDDATFNLLHFHGHSHVNMGCSPSGTDMKYRKDLVTQLPIVDKDSEFDSFYIFLIFNKRGEWTGQIYDVKYNALYETEDIKIEIGLKNGNVLSDFISEAKKVAVKETPKLVLETGKEKKEEKSFKTADSRDYTKSYNLWSSGYGSWANYDDAFYARGY